MTTAPCTCNMWQQLTPYSSYMPVPCFVHPPAEPESTSDTTTDTADGPVEMTEYVWLAENGANLGDIFALSSYLAIAEYAGWDRPLAVLAYDHDQPQWHQVTTTVEHVATDELDFMHYRLTCTWDDHTETCIYAIDGRS